MECHTFIFFLVLGSYHSYLYLKSIYVFFSRVYSKGGKIRGEGGGGGQGQFGLGFRVQNGGGFQTGGGEGAFCKPLAPPSLKKMNSDYSFPTNTQVSFTEM